jgi:hypothetical protein
MHKNCFFSLLNDGRYQRQYDPDSLIEKRHSFCARCHDYIYRKNAQCPFCRKMQQDRLQREKRGALEEFLKRACMGIGWLGVCKRVSALVACDRVDARRSTVSTNFRRPDRPETFSR